MEVTAASVKELREQTGAGVMECKKALVDAGGNLERAKDILRQQGLDKADKKFQSGRVASQGVIESYIHAGGRIGAMVELNCETDFVAKTDEFRQLARQIAMQVAAMSPRYVAADEVPAEDQERAAELALLSQASIRDPGVTIGDLIKRSIAKVGETIRVSRFSRYELGQRPTEDAH